MTTTQLNLVGQTPLVSLSHFAQGLKLKVKLESKNPLFSVKDRAALGMIKYAEQKDQLKPGDLLVEPTSGNTGIALAWISRLKGYRLILTMPETMSVERRQILEYLGAELILTEGAAGMKGAIAKAHELVDSRSAHLLNQFQNPGNPQMHYETTGPEILTQSAGKVDIVVFGVGTGGTLTGAGRYLKEQNPYLKVVAVEPKESPVLSGGSAGPHKIQGIGAGFKPELLDLNLIDEVVQVASEDAFTAAQELGQKEGILAGISSGAAAYAAREVASKYPDKQVVSLLPDTGERYLSTPLFANNQQ
jgi:cysteine synthase A